jgi:hypothetical protein
MNPELDRRSHGAWRKSKILPVQPFKLTAILLAAFFFTAIARAQSPIPIVASSRSGQFTITAPSSLSSLFRAPGLATNCLRLDPALLAVSAENFKESLWRQIGLSPAGPGGGKIFFDLRPARSALEAVTITSRFFVRSWDYHVAMPDVVPRQRYARALSGVLLLEIANRRNQDPARSIEAPQWLVAGLAQQILATDGPRVALSIPARSSGGILQVRVNESRTGIDPLADARLALENLPAVTFDELSWPSDLQLDGGDGGAYLACAQLFTVSLLALPDGSQKLRTFLAGLPDCQNWQTAFFNAFQGDFKRPLDVEKWWSLRLVNFTAHTPGPHWTTEESLTRFDDLLAVPVEFRSATNALPQHMTVTLQTAIRSFSRAEIEAVLGVKVRDFGMAQFRMAAPFDALAAAYRTALADYLGRQGASHNVVRDKHGQPVQRYAGTQVTLKKLDELDARRREFEVKLIALPSSKSPPARQN